MMKIMMIMEIIALFFRWSCRSKGERERETIAAVVDDISR